MKHYLLHQAALLLILVVLPSSARVREKYRFPEEPRGFDSGEITPVNDPFPFPVALLDEFDDWIETVTGTTMPDHGTEADLPTDVLNQFDQWIDSDNPADQVNAQRAVIVEALHEIEHHIVSLIQGLSSETPSECENRDTDFCCGVIMRLIEEYTKSKINEIPNYQVELEYEWQSWAIDLNFGGDRTEFTFSCRSVIHWIEHDSTGLSQGVREDWSYSGVNKVFFMRCVKPYQCRYLDVARARINTVDRIGVCVNRNTKAHNLNTSNLTIRSEFYAPVEKVDVGEINQGTEDTIVGTLCNDLPNDMFDPEPDPDDIVPGGGSNPFLSLQLAAKLMAHGQHSSYKYIGSRRKPQKIH